MLSTWQDQATQQKTTQDMLKDAVFQVSPGPDLLCFLEQKEAPVHISCVNVLLKETPADKMELNLH